MIEREVDRVLFERRLENEKKLKNNLALANSIPDFEEIYKREKALKFEKNKAVALGEKFENEAELEKTEKLLADLLKTRDLQIKDLRLHFTCKKCEDTGFVGGVECECVKRIRSDLMKEKSLTKNFKSFSDCDYTLFDNPAIVGFYNLMQQWSLEDLRTKFFVTILGKSGVGKTFLMECIANEFLTQNKSVVFKTAFEMNNDFLKAHTTFDKTKLKFIEPYLTSDALFIDDLGTEPIYNNVTREYLFLIINQRLVDKKITILSSNLELKDIIEIYGERTFSRLVSKQIGFLLKFTNSDIRLKKINARIQK